MEESFDVALRDVDNFITRNRRDYERFLDIVYREMGEYRDLRKNSSPIYRIYTRADKQIGGEKLKSRLGIAKKLAGWRDNDPGGRISVSKIHDIIGITVVTYFESEVKKVVDALKRARFRSFSVVSEDEIRRDDYNADHVVVRQNGRGMAFGGFLCEIQIKSLLHDSWSTRTHDIYKDRNRTPEIDRRVAALTKLVVSLEQQSDMLREELESHSIDDNVRRDAAAIRLLYQLTQAQKDAVQHGKGNAHLATQLLKNRDYFSDCAMDDHALVQALNTWHEAREASGNFQEACRFMTVLALLRTSRDFDNEAIEAVNTWFETAETEEESAKALSLCALTNWALGNSGDAIRAARQLVEHVHARGMKTSTAQWNLAYYLAEECYVMENPQLHAAELHALIDEQCLGDDDRQSMSFRDTLGAIKIMTATTRKEIFEGQRLCQDAWKWASESADDQQIFQLFYDLHESRAIKLLQKC